MTTTMPTKTDTTTWERVLDALRSGEYEQTQHGLCRVQDNGERAHCCMGVIDEVIFGTGWHNPGYEGYYVNDDDEESNISAEKAGQLGLLPHVTKSEVAYLQEYAAGIDQEYQRYHALPALNDAGVDFDTIAMIVETLGWDQHED